MQKGRPRRDAPTEFGYNFKALAFDLRSERTENSLTFIDNFAEQHVQQARL